MILRNYLSITPEISKMIEKGRPVVALESTILSHGMPYPENIEFSKKVEVVVREHGAVPATTAIIDGKLKVGLSAAELEMMCAAEGVAKISRRDIAVCVTSGKAGATTVASTMIIAAMAGIKVFATGGIGGVHRGGENSFDISADLEELANTGIAVVCAGAKSILDIGLTLEYLETAGVPVIGYKTDSFPAFYCRNSGFGVDFNAETPKQIASIIEAQLALGLKSGMVIANPIPEQYELDFDEMERVINNAVISAQEKSVTGKNLTPFLLGKIKELTGGDSFASNLQLAYNNAGLAADIAVELSAMKNRY